MLGENAQVSLSGRSKTPGNSVKVIIVCKFIYAISHQPVGQFREIPEMANMATATVRPELC